MSEPDRTNLPIRRLPFQGVSSKTLDGSKPDWNLIGHPEAPPGAPNVLLVLIDDAGRGICRVRAIHLTGLAQLRGFPWEGPI